nr:PKD domain-containing protein [Cellulomonas sp. APG4]
MDASLYTGLTSDTAAASCWEVKQLHPESPSGAYWLLTPEMTAPAQFWCDQETDGGGWVKVAHGRNAWETLAVGRGNPSSLLTATPAANAVTTQLPARTVDALLDDAPVASLAEGVRIRRAASIDGSSWQEVRMRYLRLDDWGWTMGASHQLAGWTVGGLNGSGGSSSSFGSGSSSSRVDTSIGTNHQYTWGFSYGNGVTGSSAATSYLWTPTDGQGGARPFAEVYVRPRLLTAELTFPVVPNQGTSAIEQEQVPDSLALPSSWGVAGLAGSTSGEGNVEVQALAQVGNVMYVGGNFRYVQQNASGSGRVEQSYLAAFNATTGAYIPGFTPTFDEAVQALTALPDGRLAVGGKFSQVNGSSANGLVVLNSNGSRASGWTANLVNNVSPGVASLRTLHAEGDWLYIGGNFTHVQGATGNQVYSRNAARVAVANGQPDASWRPEFTGSVRDVDVAEDGSRAYFAGFFESMGTETAENAAAVSTSSPPQLDAWTPVWSADKSYQQGIEEVADRVWVGGSEHSLFSWDTSTYERLSTHIANPKGDFQAVEEGNGFVFAGAHANNFLYDGATAWPSVGNGWSVVDTIGWIGAWRTGDAKVVSTFSPTMRSRLGSGIWAIEVASDGTVWAGGDIESGRVTGNGNGWLGGFARFPQVDATAPNAPGNLRVGSQTATTVTLAWNAPSGGVGSGGSYQVIRDDRVIATASGTSLTVPKGGGNRFFVRAADAAGNVSASTPVLVVPGGNAPPVPVLAHSVDGLDVTFDATGSTDDQGVAAYYWTVDGTSSTDATFTHTFVAGGTYPVTLVVVDTQGAWRRAELSLELVQPRPADAYGGAVFDDTPLAYWRLDETSGTVAQDAATGQAVGTYQAGVTQGEATALVGVTGTSARFDGSNDQVVATSSMPGPTTYAAEAWFRTTTTRGGKIFGFGNASSGLSSSYDRHVYMTNDGRLVFGAYTGVENRVTSPAAYNDGQWHHVVAQQGPAGMELFVDGALVGSDPQTGSQAYTGYWRVGGDRVWGGASSSHLAGWIDEFALYAGPLSAQRIAQHHAAGTGVGNQLPTPSFTADVSDLTVDLDASASADVDGTVDSYAWDLGDGAAATGVQVEHAYAAAGTYNVTLTVTDDQGATAQLSQQVTVTEPPNQAPTASFTADVTDLTVGLDASASSDADGTVAAYTWDLGDGSTATGATAEHTYAAAGTYTVSLTVTDDDGATDVASEQVTVTEPEEPGEPVVSTPVAEDATWSWRFETEAPPAEWKTLGFDASSWETGAAPLGWGSSVVTTDIDIDGPTTDRSRAAYFVHELEIADASDVVELELDSIADDGVVIYVNGTEVVRHNMRDGDVTHMTFAPSARRYAVAAADPVVVDVPVGLLVDGTNVIAAETHVNYRGTPDLTFRLEATLTEQSGGAPTTPPDGGGGDGGGGDDGGTGEPPANAAPTAAFTAAASDLGVTLDASGSSDTDGTVAGYAWDLGDGSTATGASVEHTYAAAGTYPVTLTVTDDDGATASVTQDVAVTAPADPGEPVEGVESTLVAADATWAWRYEADAPPAEWNQPGFDASSWETGGATLGFDAPVVVTDIDIDGPTSDRPRAAYFRHEVEIPDASAVQRLVLDSVADDGVVIYVNGTEVVRHNMRDGEVTHLTYAPSARNHLVAADDPVVVEVPLELLVDGVNVIAAETHVNYRATRDLTFRLEATMTAV